jgi:hypothetical protein
MEGDLKINESAELKKYLQNHPDHYHDRELFSKTRLEATNEVFQDKKSLKQPVPFFVVHRTLVRYAAAALLLLSLIGGSAYLINRSMFSNEERMAQQQNVKSVIKPAIQNAPVKDVPPANVAHDENASVEKSSLANVSTPVNQNASQEKLPVEEIKESINQHELTESSSEKHIEPIASITGTGIPTNLDQSPDKTRSHQPVSSQPAASSDEQYMTVWEALRKASNKEMMKLAGQPQNDEPLAYAEQQSPGLAEIVGSGIGKLTNEKITYSEQNDEEGKKSGFRFAIGGFAIEK